MERILFVVNDASFFLNQWVNIARAALEAGYEFHVAAPESTACKKADSIRALGLKFHPYRLDRGGQTR